MPFDEQKAQKAVDFFKKILVHTKGKWKGQPFNLLPWQEKLIREMYGTVKEDGYRQYKTIYVEVGKKNGKSELAGGVALKGLCADNENSGEVYGAASNRKQASIVFRVASIMVKLSKVLRKKIKITASKKMMEYRKTDSTYEVVSKETSGQHGYNSSTVVIDELHVVPEELYEILTFGAGDAREQPLFFLITTAGNSKAGIAYKIHEYALKVQKGIIDDPTFLPCIFSLAPDEDWEDEENWKKVNPSLGHTIKIESVREAYRKAKNIPSEESKFRQLRLNQWVSSSEKWLNVDQFKKCRADLDINSYKGRDLFLSLDLSSTTDITALCFCFPDYENDLYDLFFKFYIPEDNIVKRVKENVNYDVWVREGFITATKGNIIDYQYIKRDILNTLSDLQVNIKEVSYDPFNSSQLVVELQDEGLEMVQFRQGFLTMNPACKELEIKQAKQQFRYQANPVLEWMADNVVIEKDAVNNIKPSKKKSIEKIDGIVAQIMALYRAIICKDLKQGKSVYDDDDIKTL